MPAKKNETLSFDDITRTLSAGLLNAARKPNVLNYDPHDKQIVFHKSCKNGRQYVGGNRSGKTVGGIVEDIFWARGEHPYQSVFEPPTLGRIVTVDFKNGWNKIIQPVLRQWLPPSLLINGSWEDSWDGQKHVLTLANDSTIEIMSHDQDLETFAGVPRHWTHFDEECSEDIFNECKARLVDYGGHWWITMTPVEGMTWTYEKIFEPAFEGNDPLVDVIIVDMLENKHLSFAAIQEYIDGLDANEVEIRRQGKYIALGGLIMKYLREAEHYIEDDRIPPASWDHYLSLDHGFSNPTAWLWHAVDPRTGVVLTYDEHYKSEMTVEQHAAIVKEKEAYYRKEYGIIPVMRVADPAIKQRNGSTGYSIQIEYALQGLNMALGSIRMVDAGLNRMNTYLQRNQWFIGPRCPNLKKELRKYSFKRYDTGKVRSKNNNMEIPQKKDDHAIDSSRYFFSFMPELTPLKAGQAPTMGKAQLATLMGAGTTFNPAVPMRIDTNLTRHGLDNQPVYVIDETVGGEW